MSPGLCRLDEILHLIAIPIVTWSNKGIFSWIISPRMRSRLFDQISCFATLPPISSIFTPSRRSFTQNGKFQKEKWGKSCSFTRYELEHSLKANLPSTIQQRYPRMKYYYPPGSRLGLLYSALRKLWKIELRQASTQKVPRSSAATSEGSCSISGYGCLY